jgi:hypothetical protein
LEFFGICGMNAIILRQGIRPGGTAQEDRSRRGLAE